MLILGSVAEGENKVAGIVIKPAAILSVSTTAVCDWTNSLGHYWTAVPAKIAS
jgi:hypothetical protein